MHIFNSCMRCAKFVILHSGRNVSKPNSACILSSELTRLSRTISSPDSIYLTHDIRHYSSRQYDPQKTGRIVKQIASHVDQLVNSYDRMFEKRAPHAYKLYSTFKSGLRRFFQDTREYSSLRLQLGTSALTLDTLTHKQLQLLRQYPRDFRRTGLTIFISLLPFTLYFILPVAFTFPRLLLSRHFWSPEQLAQFSALEHRKRLEGGEVLLRHMYLQGKHIPDPLRRRAFLQVVKQVRARDVMTLQHLKQCLPLFSGLPFRLESLGYRHRRLLSRACGWPGSASGLSRDMQLLLLADSALQQEGLAHLNQAELQACCLERGVFAGDMSCEDMLRFLTLWLQRPDNSSDRSLGLLAHLPLLVSHRQPQNLKLLSRDQQQDKQPPL